jgi:uncharacterized protein YcfJ
MLGTLKEDAMNARKTILTLAAGTLFAAAPAFADHARWGPAHGHRYEHEQVVLVQRHHRPVAREVVVVRQPVVVRRTVIVNRPVYVERPVYVGRPVHYGVPHTHPAPVYAAPNQVLHTLGGAIIGAAIGSQIGHGNGRTAATAIGAVVGGVIGSGM